MIQPTIGPPIGVEPWKATNHSDITRPRISGSEFSCRVELPVDMNEMLADAGERERDAARPASDGRDRRDRQSRREPRRGQHQRPQAGRAAGGDEQPADDCADAHRRGHEPEPGRADIAGRGAAITGSETWNS